MPTPITPTFSEMPEKWADDLPSDDDVPPPPPPQKPWHGEEWRCAAEERGGFFPTLPPPDEAAEARGGLCPEYNWAARVGSPAWQGHHSRALSETASISSVYSIHTPSVQSGCIPPPEWMPQDMVRWVGPVPHLAPAPHPLHMGGGGISPVPAKRGRAARRVSKAGSSVSGGEARTVTSATPSGLSAPAPTVTVAGMDGVRKLLDDAGFGQYAEAFDSAGLDRVDLVASATDEELRECGVKPVHRRRILQAAMRVEEEKKAEAAAGPNPLMLLPTPARPRNVGGWTEEQESGAAEWLRMAAEQQGARICITGCKYQHDSSTLVVRYLSPAGGVVPSLAPLLRAAQDYFLCRVWMGPAQEIEDALSEQNSKEKEPHPPQPSAASLEPRPEHGTEEGSDKGGRSRSAPAALRQTTVC